MRMTERCSGGHDLPVVDLEGPARQRGRAHGESLRARIARGLDAMAGEIGATTQRPLADLCGEFLARTSFIPAIERWTPGLLDEVRGIAEGSGFPYETILVYSLLDEWGWHAQESHASGEPPRNCSAIGLRRATGGHPVVSQTHDLPISYADTLAVLRVHGANGVTALVLTAAGAIALSGINDSGVSINCNSLVSDLPHSSSGLPVAFLVRGVLERRSLAAARAFVESVEHASGQNYVLGGPDDVCDLECSAEKILEVDRGRAAVLHTNHPVAQPGGAKQPDADSRARLAFLESRRPALKSLQDVCETMQTPPVCKYPWTVAAIAGELSVPPRVLVTAGAPDRVPWFPIGFARGVG